MQRDRQIPRRRLKTALLGGAAAMLMAGSAMAQDASIRFDIAAQDAGSALNDFSRQSGVRVLFPYDAVAGKHVPAVHGDMTIQEALNALTKATGLVVAANDGQTVTLTAPQSGSAAGDGADQGTVQALIVTAQKREENIQDVPIAMSAFTQEDLTRAQVAGGPDLMTQVPNFTFTKTNFSSYSIQIRGIGTQAISATVDPAVAVAFNNTPFVRNRFFEQEFYDLERVEVLRGPQGTLYGRNATAGVVNIISAKPKFHYEAKLSVDVGNYNSRRLEGMINLPLAQDKVALRLAGALTKRDGYVTNQQTGRQIDGRDLWSGRATLAVEPTDGFRAYLIYEHFEENDDRLRSDKQLCKRNPNPTHFGSLQLPTEDFGGVFTISAFTSQGCEAASLYSPESFQTPNGWALPYYGPLENYGGFPGALGGNPYVSATQSRDLRVIESSIQPNYDAKNDIVELQISWDLNAHLKLASETGYNSDKIFSFEDFNRFTTRPGAWRLDPDLIASGRLTPDGQFCDPQLGCSDRLLAGDLSTARSHQFAQELRLSSDFEGPFNFSLGANFLRYDTDEKYYVFFNSLALLATTPDSVNESPSNHYYVPNQYDGSWCLGSFLTSNPNNAYGPLPFGCKYIDPNPIGSLNDQGRNYFLSKNPYKLISYALFGEATYQVTPTLKLTGGLRWTVDKKEAPVIPIWLLAVKTYGLPVLKTVRQKWSEPTGRAVVDWKPDLGFTDDTLIYASYSHGYKAGGANPPLPVNVFSGAGSAADVQAAIQSTHPATFGPEFVNAYEVGSKNTLLDGKLTLNGDVFYYDYTGYQISQIMDRSAINTNFDAKVWGAELEADWRPMDNLRLGLKGGYERTRIADGQSAVDTMDRTAGHTDWAVIKPFPTVPSNCIMPIWWLDMVGTFDNNLQYYNGGMCNGYFSNTDPVTGRPYMPNPTQTDFRDIPPGYPGFDPASAPNHGQGFSKPLGGHELPNAPHLTVTVTADYSLPLPSDWLMTLHGDFYYQSEAWTRVFNTPGYDKLKAYNNVNLAAIFANEDRGWQVMAYVKNVFNKDNITGAFLNSDDTGLTTNVFLNEPRLYGLRVTKNWTGDWVLGSGRTHTPGEPYPITVELGGGVEKIDAPAQAFAPSLVDTVPAAADPSVAQGRPLDWSDSRDVRLTYAPSGSPWRLSAAVRYGKANSQDSVERKVAVFQGCGVAPAYQVLCDHFPQIFVLDVSAYGTAQIHNQEKFSFADFTVGHDVGLGLGQNSTSSIELGLRYAELQSSTQGMIRASGGWELGDTNPYFKYAQHTRGVATFRDQRRFRGAGPIVAWTGSKALFGNERGGEVGLDVNLTAGALIGDRTTRIRSAGSVEHYGAPYYAILFGYALPTTSTLPPLEWSRTERATAPIAGARLGLFYSVAGVKISTGYRIDRMFNALDGGSFEAKSYDRTIQGPYFKIAIGFGG